jgi:DNA-binding NarL/FixJ family response regulator/signal transduction histidine kinase
VSDLRHGLRIAGWSTAAVVAVSTALSGLPRDRSGQLTILLLTAAALAAWLVSLASRVQAPPLLVGCLVGMGLAGAWLSLLHPTGPGFLVSFMAMAGIGLQLPRPIAVPAGAVVLVAAGFVQAHTSTQPVTAALSVATGAAFLFLAAAFAAVSRDNEAQAQELLAHQEQVRVAREQAAVLAERSRLARELHDVLAHTLAGLAVHLEAARLLALSIDGDPRLTEQVTAAQRLARDGLSDAKRAVSTLRSEELPGPDDLPWLIEDARRRGMPVGYTVAGRPRPLSGRDRARGLPHRAGGDHQRCQARRRGCHRDGAAGLDRRRGHRRGERPRRRPDHHLRRPALRALRADRAGRTCRAVRWPAHHWPDARWMARPPHPAVGERERTGPGDDAMTHVVRVLVADDQKVVRDGLALMLGLLEGIEVVGTAIDGADAVRQAASAHPDVVLMDLVMPTMDGVEATRRLARIPDGPRVVVLTTYADDDWVFRALRAGARGYLTKDASAEDIHRAVITVAAGQAQLDPAVQRRLLEALAAGASVAVTGVRGGFSPDVGLTHREVDVLRHIADGASNTEIADRLCVSEATVKTHVSHLLAKTGCRDRAALVAYAFRSGQTPHV